MEFGLSFADWAVIGGYLAIVVGAGWVLSLRRAENADDYFLGGQQMSLAAVAVSVLATSQSAATFLGGPDQSFRGDLTYLATNIGTILAVVFVGMVLIPKFYQHRVTTVYELLQVRFDSKAMRSAGAMYLVGRVFASGARLYLATIAVSMLIFGDIAVESIVPAAALLTLLGFLLTFLGGIRSIIWSDALQCLVYVSAAIAVVWFLLTQIPSDIGTIAAQLQGDGVAVNKLTLFNWSLDFSQPFSMSAILVGFFLLGVASFGLDQDMTQRVLTCKDERSGRRALYLSALLGIPVVALFLVIGLLLHVFYERPDLMTTSTATLEPTFSGEAVTVFMYYILSELPTGLKGLVVAGVVAAALSTLNSGMNSMSSVLVKDFYLPILRKEKLTSPKHVVTAGRIGMAMVGLSLFLMSVLCFYWQRYTDMPLLEFALSVMVFAYSGLLGVYFTAIFTNRGSSASVIAALIVGFLATLVQQAYIVDATMLPAQFKALAFPWQLAIGAGLSFVVCALPTGKETQTKSSEKLDAA